MPFPECGNTGIGGNNMEQKQNLSNEQQRRNVVEKMWLNYFNNTLLEKGMISPEDHHRMKVYISTRKPSAMER